MARKGLFPMTVMAALLFVATAFVTPVLAQEEGEAETSLDIEGVMNTSDSLAWSASDSIDEMVQVEEAPSGIMGWFEQTPLGQSGAGQLFIAGGNFMWGLLAAAILALAVILERAFTLAKARTNTRRLIGSVITTLRSDGVNEAAQVCERTRGPIAAILHSGLLRAERGPEAVEKAIETSGTIEMAFLERGLVALSAVANTAPLLGFLGTVSGMISAFEAIANADNVNAKLVASGISEALITTASGLIIAIPASLGHSFFLSIIDRFIIEMEETSAELVEELTQIGHR
ncbi:MAG TPA: MotA/TolQ/ExbB proton channel family protein [Candidatus Krumholzibacteria bacterium]|nr:MotA/TolQ/ExbB proton channel family protein [Candidatus Krumholzibacteria bacterium]